MKLLEGYKISKELLTWLSSNIPEGSVILELGSGEGTQDLVKNYKVYSIEHDIDWIDFVSESHYIYAPLRQYTYGRWYDIQCLKHKLPKYYDVILVDGPPRTGRLGFLHNLDLFNTDVPIIVDDTHRKDEQVLVRGLVNTLGRESELHKSKNKTFTILKDYENTYF